MLWCPIHAPRPVILSDVRRVPQLGAARHCERTERRIFNEKAMAVSMRRAMPRIHVILSEVRHEEIKLHPPADASQHVPTRAVNVQGRGG